MADLPIKEYRYVNYIKYQNIIGPLTDGKKYLENCYVKTSPYSTIRALAMASNKCISFDDEENPDDYSWTALYAKAGVYTYFEAIISLINEATTEIIDNDYVCICGGFRRYTFQKDYKDPLTGVIKPGVYDVICPSIVIIHIDDFKNTLFVLPSDYKDYILDYTTINDNDDDTSKVFSIKKLFYRNEYKLKHPVIEVHQTYNENATRPYSVDIAKPSSTIQLNVKQNVSIRVHQTGELFGYDRWDTYYYGNKPIPYTYLKVNNTTYSSNLYAEGWCGIENEDGPTTDENNINQESGNKDNSNPDGDKEAIAGRYPSTNMGGNGTFDDSTDLMEETTLPNIDISDLGFIGLWEPSKAELQQLAAIVWNDPWNLKEWPDIWKAALIKPLDNIISLAMFPFPATYRDENHNNILTVNNETFVFGGYICDGALPGTRKLTMNKVKQQIIDYSMGEISLKEYFGSFMDYAPYTTIQLYLPFYGFVDIDTNSVMNCDSLKVKYRINLLDGSAVIKIYVKKSADSAKQSGSVQEQFLLSEYNTNVKLDIALSSGDNAAILQRQVDYATFIANGLTGGAFLYGGIANAPKGTTTTKAFRLPPQNWRAEQRTMARAQSDNATDEDRMQATMDLFSPGMNAIIYASSPDERKAAYKHYYGLEETEVNNSKDTNKGASNGRAGYEDVSRAIPSISIPSGGACRGNVGGGSSGFMGELRPYLIITRPIQVLPEQFGELNGYPLEVSVELGNLKGFVKVENIRLDNMDATDDEKHAITKQLMDGVFL